MVGRFMQLAFGLLVALLATPSMAAGDGAFLRTQGFGVNYGLTGEKDSGPRPPEFHLDLAVSTIFSENLAKMRSDYIVASYVQRTVEKVFAKLVGTDETPEPYAMPAFRLINRQSAH